MVKRPQFITPAGTFLGWYDRGVIKATGITYAHAARFQPPLPAPVHQEVVDASSPSCACPQAAVPLLEDLLGSAPLAHLQSHEQCLQLSITRPAEAAAHEKLPVMIWIHGGSYKSGAGDAHVYDPAALVREQRVMVVNVTYRLGLFGFLGGYQNRAANLGLLDIIEALRWVKKNGAHFGGDVANTTLFGQSAGGDAIAHLMIADGTEGLFKRVIIQSAPLGISLGRQKMNAAMGRSASGISVDHSSAEMVSMQEGVLAAAKSFGLKGGMAFGVQYGHAPLPAEDAIGAAWSQRASQYEVLIGYTKEETSLFLPRMNRLRRVTALPVAGALLKKFFVKITTDRVYRKAAIAFAARHAKNGGTAYLYCIHWGLQANGFGATHTIDLPLLFGDEETWRRSKLIKGIPWQQTDEDGKRVRALWVNFARSGRLPEQTADSRHILNYKRII